MKRIPSVLIAALVLLAGCSGQPENSGDEDEPVSVEESATIMELAAESEPEEANPQDGDGLSEVDDDTLYVRLTFDGGEAIVSLEDNVAAKGWYDQLPLTLTFEDFHDQEKICRLPDEISTGDMKIGNVPEVGDISLYIPWNTLVFYYDEYDGNDSSVPIGRVESGLDLLRAAGDEFTVTMEPMSGVVSDAEQTDSPSIQANTTDITMTVGDAVITATLDDSETSREFLSTLPRTISMTRYADREYYGRMEALSANGEVIPDFSDGDVTLYLPGPSLAIFFANEDQSSLAGLIRMGRITSDLAEIYPLEETVEMRIEIVS